MTGVQTCALPISLRAGAGDDGLLEAREILDVRLQADLAVLSACDTGRGELHEGEGVLGLGWAFLSAGAASAAVSQWQVDSQATSELMLAFHRGIEKGLTPTALRGKAESLRRASLSMLQGAKYKHPFYWAGFSLLGDGL